MVDRWMSYLFNVYDAPNRHYHNWIHIKFMLKHLEMYKYLLTDKEHKDLMIAVYFHDVINTPIMGGTDEKQSALIAEDFCRAIDYPHDNVVRCILATDHFNIIPTSQSENLMCDLDLLHFALLDLHEVNKNLRAEYYRYSDEEFKKGSRKILNYFLEKPKIYRTLIQYEAMARENIKEYLDESS